MKPAFSRQDVIDSALIMIRALAPGEVISRASYLHLESLAQAMGVPEVMSGSVFLEARRDMAVLIYPIYFGPKFSLWDRFKIWLRGNLWLKRIPDFTK